MVGKAAYWANINAACISDMDVYKWSIPCCQCAITVMSHVISNHWFIKLLLLAQNKENIKATHYWHFCEGNPQGSGGLPHQRSQCGEHFRIMKICSRITQIAKFMGLTWGPPGSCRPQMGPMLAPWTLLSGKRLSALLQLHLQSQLNTWLQWIERRQLREDTRNI